ncbi:MAG: peptidase C45 [Bryobacteraceae bacterium]|nr:peptidase C45 [Bryobacteraceae bacterium]
MPVRPLIASLTLLAAGFTLASYEPKIDPRLDRAYKLEPRNGWTFVHLEGAPSEIGFQHGYLLAKEIEDGYKVIIFETEHDTDKDWEFFRRAAREVHWPRIEREYREEMQGIADGLKARGVKFDVWDVAAVNAWLEWGGYVKLYDKEHGKQPPSTVTPRESCSAFVATGSYSKDGRVVMAHNAWTSYMDGQRWTMVFDIAPRSGHRILMDGYPGLIHSADDFGVNAAGIMITETTISKFSGYDPKGVPEFVRARKAMQYSASIDDFARIMREGNNGGYANNWLVADRKNGEIGSLELGLKNTELRRTKDGYFVGSNFPVNEKLAREETDFPLDNMSLSPNARRVRWTELMEQNKGRIDVEAAQRFLADHWDSYENKEAPSERTLCGHVDLSPRGVPDWQPPYGIAGAVQNKAIDSRLAEGMSLVVAAGHACGRDFHAAEHLAKHPEFAWQKGVLRDMPSRPWTPFRIDQR